MGELRKSEDDKRHAAVLYFTHGSTEKVAELLNGKIAGRTIRDWKNSDPIFMAAYDQCRLDNEDYYRTQATQIINKVFTELNDRLDNGDVKVERVDDADEYGKKVRKSLTYREPVKAKDVAWIGAVYTDKLRVLNGLPSHISKKAPDEAMAMEKFMAIYKKFEDKTLINGSSSEVKD